MNDIDRLLREDAARELPDHGFSQRVMRALPAQPVRTRAWLRPVLVFGSAALGSILAVALSPHGNALLDGYRDLVQLQLLTPAAMTGIAMSAALLLSALVVAAHPD